MNEFGLNYCCELYLLQSNAFKIVYNILLLVLLARMKSLTAYKRAMGELRFWWVKLKRCILDIV